MNKLITNTTAH